MDKIKKLLFSFRGAAKSVLINYKEYVGIYIAIIVVQLLLGVWTMSAFTNYHSNNQLFEDNYKYDVLITDSSISLKDMMGVFRADKSMVTDYGMHGDALGVSIKSGTLENFKKIYLDKNNADYTVTPYYAYHTEMQSEILITSLIIGVFTFGVCVLILSVIHSVRTNHYRFQYGIYMAFGADRKMLCRLVAQELFTINTLLLVPSAVVSYLLLFLIYVFKGVTVLFTLPQIILYVVLTYLVVTLASGSSIGGLFFKYPVALISAADNSHFVSSPRRSFNIFGKNIPLKYELYSVWRFRKYILKLVSGAVAFSVIFVTIVYCANMVLAENNAPADEYTIKFNNSTYVEAQREKANTEAIDIINNISDLSQVEKIDFEQSKGFKYLYDHVLLKSNNVSFGTSITVSSQERISEGYTKAINNCRYVCVDSLALANYEKAYAVEYLDGCDAQSFEEREDLVVVSEGLFGVKCFDFSPGDKIIIADKREGGAIPVVSDPLEVLNQQILNFNFDYKEYTVGAVIHDTDASQSIIIGLNQDNFYDFTHEKRAISKLNVSFKNGLSLAEISEAHSSVDKYMSNYESWSVQNHDAAINSYVDEKIDLPALLYLLSALVLVICPLIWIFSQTMFFKKREPEFRTLGYIGVGMKEIFGIHIVSGILIFVLGFVLNFAFSRLVCYGIYRILTAYLPKIGILGVSVSFDSFVPLEVMLICAAVSALCGFVSSIIPFVIYRNKLKREADAVKKADLYDER